ncbi:MAG: glycoside hydrolase family 20 zincin-like fold domain-containing protein, partial [Tannerellaceae bacterium]
MIINKLTNSFCTFIFASAISTSFIACSETHKTQNLALIPYPTEIKINNDKFIFSPKVSIATDTLANKELINYLNTRLKETIGYKLDIDSNAKSNCINLELNNDTIRFGQEGYSITVNNKIINIIAASENGLFYGIQTLLQMATTGQADYTSFEIPAVEIEDKPAFQWRGIMLDVSRHFQSKEYIKRFIDILAFHKINTFHWHL